jgi:hypothetical protein
MNLHQGWKNMPGTSEVRSGHGMRHDVPVSAELKRDALKELERILESPPFHGSHRAQRLLRYMVEHALTGQADRIKERTIGIELFGREASYDTGQDAIVRVAANDVRKRLTECYEQTSLSQQGRTMRISLPPGCYVPEFQLIESTQGVSETVPMSGSTSTGVISEETKRTLDTPTLAQTRPFGWIRTHTFALAATALALAGVLFGYYLYMHPKGKDVLGEFWSPVLQSQKPVLVCVAQPMVYRLPDQPSEDRFVPEHEETAQAQPEQAPSAQASGHDRLIPMADAFVGVGDAYAVADISSFLGSRGKAWQLRAGTDAISADLRSAPVILIGAYTNPWTRKLTQNLRFVFVAGNLIRDKAQPGRQWAVQVSQDWKTPEDYAIISRFSSSQTGETVMVAAGVTNFGTQAASEFLTNARLLEATLKGAPADWQSKNLQFVIHTRIIGKTPGPPTLVASHFW